jgi:putative addiction module component (TIGR02574 family)
VATSNAKKLLSDAMELPSEDRARLAAALLASLDDGEDDDADRAWAAEIERRADRVIADGSSGEPWPAVRARLLARLHRS